jgi:cytochrome c oxidase cbb3-type subunit III
VNARALSCSLLWIFCLAVTGCNQLPGKPKPGPEVPRPDQIVDFPTLYSQNCSGCHGDGGKNGSAYPLANPVYQSLVDEQGLRKVVANGLPGTLMPAFAISAGGSLTEQQVDVLATGMRTAWYKAGTGDTANAPAYKASKPADPNHGPQVYATYCAACHGEATPSSKTAVGKSKAGSIVDPAFLALVSDQALRTVVIAGRPDIGQPDWRNDVAGHPMSDQEVTDVVGWLSSMRPRLSGGGSQ